MFRIQVALLCLIPVALANLRLVALVFRHGDRSPTGTYPTDPHKDFPWPNGFGQLTQLGMVQQYELGTHLRKRYTTENSETYLFDGSYSRNEVYVRSTDVDRTLMSAECQMAAFYHPNGSQVFLKNLKWQPVPIHTVPKDEDNVLHAFTADCPVYKQFENNLINDPDWVQKRKENQWLLDYLKNKTGVTHEMDLHEAGHIGGILFAQQQHNLSLPSWLSQQQYETLLNISVFRKMKRFEGLTAHRLTAGILVNDIVTNMQNKKEQGNNPNEQKLFIYSAHDDTLVALLSALNLFDGENPPYASVVMIELYSELGQYTVKIYYHKGPKADSVVAPPLLPLPGCDSSCPLNTFGRLLTSVLINETEWKKECQLTSSSQPVSITIALFWLFQLLRLLLL